MAYTAPYIDAAGLHLPQYTDILDELITQAQNIYGQDIYLGNDSADYQFLSILGLKLNDAMQSLQIVYNNRSPVQAISAGLDSIVKLNGIKRAGASYSTCGVVLTGTPSAVIQNGVCTDVNGNKWDLPASITIGSGGSISTSVQCEVLGAIAALAGDINIIATPTAGWISITNPAAAILGQAEETDSALRTRQAKSTQLPSQSMLAGTIAAIAAISDVGRYRVFENNTPWMLLNLPSFSISCIVEGGLDNDIANAIYYNKSIGCRTIGTTTVNVSDAYYAVPMAISFSRPIPILVYISMQIYPLNGFDAVNTPPAIIAALVNYINGLQIGDGVTLSGLNAVTCSVMPNLSQPTFSVSMIMIGRGQGGSPYSDQYNFDMAMAYNEVAQGNPEFIVITVE